MEGALVECVDAEVLLCLFGKTNHKKLDFVTAKPEASLQIRKNLSETGFEVKLLEPHRQK